MLLMGSELTPHPSMSEVLAASLVNSVTQALANLTELWNEMGMNNEVQHERMQAVKTHIEKLLNEMIEEERSLKEKIEKDIEIQKTQLSIIRCELQLESYQVEEGLSMLQLEKEFRLALEAAVKEKRERLEKLGRLQQEDQALCEELCATPYYIPTGSIPTLLELTELEEHVQNLLQEKLQVKKESLTASLKTLMKEVQVLWGRLQWSTEQREEIKRTASKLSISEALKMWEEHLLKLEELRKDKLEQLVLGVRQELTSYWQKCFCSEEQKAAFQPFYDDNFTEDLLSQHDEELLKMKLKYENHQDMYTSVHKWTATWERFIELEKKSTDPSRLLNRGGNLLKDERERLKIQKQLLKLSEDLKKSIESWERENNIDFLINNERLLESIAHRLEHHRLRKDQRKRAVKREGSPLPVSGAKRHAGVHMPIPQKIRKVNEAAVILHPKVLANCPLKSRQTCQ